jgi:hypothetical protein
MDKTILDAVNEWLTPSFDKETQETVKALIADRIRGVFLQESRIWYFGMRGVMGVGNNRAQIYAWKKYTRLIKLFAWFQTNL